MYDKVCVVQVPSSSRGVYFQSMKRRKRLIKKKLIKAKLAQTNNLLPPWLAVIEIRAGSVAVLFPGFQTRRTIKLDIY